MDIGKKSEFKINEGFIFQKIGKGITIFAPDKSSLFTLNETAAYIFRLIRSKKGREEIIDRIVTRFEVSWDKASKDTDQLILKLLHEGIITRVRDR